MPDRAACEAVRELASNAPADLLQVFTEEANPLATHALRRWIAWADEDAERWVREAPSRAVAALGVVGWVERDLEPGDARFSERLSRIGAALQARPRDEEIALWWQLLGIAHRICPTTTTAPAQFEELYEAAADGLGRNGGADAMPNEGALLRWSKANRELLAVLPYVAHRAVGEHGPRLLSVMFGDVTKRLEGELHELPNLQQHDGLCYANACGHATMLELSAGEPAPWWRRSLERYLSAQRGWHADLTAPAMERAAWVACTTAMACLKLAATGETGWRPAADELFELVEPELDNWLWQLGYPSFARAALPELLVRVAVLEGMSPVADRVRRIALAAPDAGTLATILREASSALPSDTAREVEQLHAERVRYEIALGSKS